MSDLHFCKQILEYFSESVNRFGIVSDTNVRNENEPAKRFRGSFMNCPLRLTKPLLSWIKRNGALLEQQIIRAIPSA